MILKLQNARFKLWATVSFFWLDYFDRCCWHLGGVAGDKKNHLQKRAVDYPLPFQGSNGCIPEHLSNLGTLHV